MNNKVVVFHPGLQHSHQLAQGLWEQGLLEKFISGVPVRNESEMVPFWMPKSLAKRMKVVSIAAELRCHPQIWWPLTRLAGCIPDAGYAHDFSHRVMHAFDRWAAGEVRRLKPKAVVAFENSAWHTFQAAKEIGARCILDAPSFHHATAARLIPMPTRGYLGEINRRKDQEVALADHILTCSGIAMDSYLEAGVPKGKISAMLLGATLPSGIQRPMRAQGRIRFIFAGAMSYRKSMDLIFKAFETLKAEGLPIELTIVGGAENHDWIRQANAIDGVTYLGQKGQRDLYEEFSRSDCLLLPSRFDSFGMVVAEAMATGVPALVSSMTGARALIEAVPGSGWVVEPDYESLLQGMRNVLASESAWEMHSAKALAAAAQFTWPAYRKRVADLIKECVLC